MMDYFKRKEEKIAREQTSLEEIIERVKGDEFKHIVSVIRDEKTEASLRADLKGSLPGFTASGTFNKRRNAELLTYSKIISLDYDKLENVTDVFNTITRLNTTRAAFISPSGNGVKVFVEVNTSSEEHKTAFNTVKSSYHLWTGTNSDRKVKDLARLCYMSHDPRAYFNSSSEVFNVTDHIQSSTNDSNQLELIANFTNKYNTFKEGSRNNYVFQYACISNRSGVSESEALTYCINNYQEPDFDESEITRTVQSAYKNNYHEHNTQGLKPIYQNENLLMGAQFERKSKNEEILALLSKSIVINENSGQVFQLNNGAIQFDKSWSQTDFILFLEDKGVIKSEAAMKRILNSDRIMKITPLNLFIEQLKGQPWDGVDRIKPLIDAAKLDRDESIKIDLITKWFCTVYSYAMREIDKDIHYNEYSRVILIFYSKETGTGKTTFFEKLGMKGRIRERTSYRGLDIYSNFAGQISKDERELGILLESKMLIQIDDIEESIINNNGTLRSIISRNSGDNRKLYTETNVHREFYATFCGSTNHRELIKEKAETRFLIFGVKEKMDFEAINNTDYMQLWSQVRHLCLKENPKNFIGPDELKMINKIAQDYCYQSDLETFLRDIYEYAEDERVELREIKRTLEQLAVRTSNSELGKAIRGLAPSGEEIFFTIQGSKKYRVKQKAVKALQDFGGTYADDEVVLPF